VEEFGSGDGCLGTRGGGVEGHEFADEGACVGVAFEGCCWGGELGSFEEEG
jgi:hypothetical protein